MFRFKTQNESYHTYTSYYIVSYFTISVDVTECFLFNSAKRVYPFYMINDVVCIGFINIQRIFCSVAQFNKGIFVKLTKYYYLSKILLIKFKEYSKINI